MTSNGMEELHSFLNSEGRKLRNVKFCIDPRVKLPKADLEKAVDGMIRRAIAAEAGSFPPVTGLPKFTF